MHAPLGAAINGSQGLGQDGVVHALQAAQGALLAVRSHLAQLAAHSGKVHQRGHKVHAAAQGVGEGVGRVGVHAQHARALVGSVLKGRHAGGKDLVDHLHSGSALEGVGHVRAARALGGKVGGGRRARGSGRRRERIHLILRHPLRIVGGGRVGQVQQLGLQRRKVGHGEGSREAPAGEREGWG